jgi:hypothetical protein
MHKLNRAALLLAAGLLAAPAGAAELKHDFSATSTATVEITGEGVMIQHVRNSRLEPYGLFDGEHTLPRLATITFDVKRRSDAEGDDPASTVSVAVDDLSAATPKRLAAFTDPGSEGDILGELYFDSRLPGCCAGPTIHTVRLLETGTLLFRATGDADEGSTAWATVPNAHPEIVRWAAFDGALDEARLSGGLIGIIRYGGPAGPLSQLELRLAGKAQDATDRNLGLSHEAKLLWVDAVSQKNGHPPATGSAANPETIWSLDKQADLAKLGGFSLAVVDYDGKRLATIPIKADRLDPTKAKLARGLKLVNASD